MAEGAVVLPDGAPSEVTVERPRQKGHGDYATNVAIQLAKKAGTNPRAFAELVSAKLAGRRRHRRCRDRRSRVPQHHGRGRRAGPGRGRHRRGRDVVRRPRTRSRARRSTWSSSRPTRPVRCTSARVRWAAVGDALGRIFTHDRRRGHPRVLLQRPRRPDRQVQPVAAGERPGLAGARGRLRRRVHPRHRRATSSRSVPTRSSCPTTTAQEVFRDGRRRHDVRRDQAVACTGSASTSTSTSTRTTCTSPAPSSGRSRDSPRSATPTRPTAHCGCAPRSTATTRTA